MSCFACVRPAAACIVYVRYCVTSLWFGISRLAPQYRPFDQYVMQYIIDPSAFSCKPLPVYMQQCSPAPWLRNNSSSSSSGSVDGGSSSSSAEPFNAGGDCPGHGPGTTARNRQQPAMMLVDLTDT
jgi:hypothetical protein